MFWYEKLGAENLSDGMSIDTPAGKFTMIKGILRADGTGGVYLKRKNRRKKPLDISGGKGIPTSLRR